MGTIGKPLPARPLLLPEFMRWLEEAQRNRAQPIHAKGKPGPYGESVKFPLHEGARHSMEGVWAKVLQWRQAHPESAGLAVEVEGRLEPLSADYITEDLQAVFSRAPEFPVSRLRAWSSRVVEHFVRQELSAGVRAEYGTHLHSRAGYWFRRSAEEHVGTGFHTALSAFYRMLSAAPATLWQTVQAGPAVLAGKAQKALGSRERLQSLTEEFLELAHYVATCHLVLLPVLDGVVWDSAGATLPKEFILIELGGVLRPAVSLVALAQIAKRIESAPWRTPDEPRLGCPALHARTPLNAPLMKGVREWCVENVQRWYWPLLMGKFQATGSV